jgi:hypothetical protein
MRSAYRTSGNWRHDCKGKSTSRIGRDQSLDDKPLAFVFTGRRGYRQQSRDTEEQSQHYQLNAFRI